MNRRLWLWSIALSVSMAAIGAAYGTSGKAGYTCPLTGQELPCENCCPLNAM